MCKCNTSSTPGNFSVLLNDDNGSYGVALYSVGQENQVNLELNVSPTLSFNIVNIDDTSDTSTCNFGNIDTAMLIPNYNSIVEANTGECGYGIALGMNTDQGFSVFLSSDGSLRNSNSNIMDVIDGQFFATGTEAYGIANITPALTGRSTSTGLYTEELIPVSPYNKDGVGMTILENQNEIFGYYDGVKYEAGNGSDDITKIIHGIVINSGTPAGMYQQILTYTVVPRF